MGCKFDGDNPAICAYLIHLSMESQAPFTQFQCHTTVVLEVTENGTFRNWFIEAELFKSAPSPHKYD